MSNIVVLLLVCVSSVVYAQDDPDLPGYGPQLEEMSSCSFIIPMDPVYQGGHWDAPAGYDDFNLAAYGLAVALLWDDIPLKWVIKSNKSLDDYDIVNVPTTQVAPFNDTTVKLRSFYGGPFMIETVYTERALDTIANYSVMNNVTVFKIETNITVDVRYYLLDRPFVAIFDSSAQNYILVAALLSAGLVEGNHFRVMSKAEANSINSSVCITMAMEPHFHCTGDVYQDQPGVTQPNITYCSTFVKAMKDFINSGGNFLSMCGGIMTYENCDDDSPSSYAPQVIATRSFYATLGAGRTAPPQYPQNCPSGFTFSQGGVNSWRNQTSGLRELSGPKGTFSNIAADTPYAQYTGNWAFDDWSSVESISLWNPKLDRPINDTGNVDPWPIVTRYPVNVPTNLSTANKAHWVIAEGSYSRDRIGYPYGLYYAGHSKLPQFQNGKGGNFFMLAGHDYGVTNHTTCNSSYCPTCYGNVGCWTKGGRRLILNAVLTPSNRSGCSIPVSVCNNGVCVIEQKSFTVDPCKWGTCKPQKKRATLDDSYASPWLCSCTQRLDACGVCGGTNQSCTIILPGVNTEIPAGDLPTGTVPPGVAVVVQGTLVPTPDPTQPHVTSTNRTWTLEEVLAFLSASTPNSPPGPGNTASAIKVVWPVLTGGSQVTAVVTDLSTGLATITLSPTVSALNQNAVAQQIEDTIANALGLQPGSVTAVVKGNTATVSFVIGPVPPQVAPSPETPTDITSGGVTDVLSEIWKYYYVVVGYNVNDFVVYLNILSQTTDTVKLYLRKGELPTTTDYDCTLTGSNLQIDFNQAIQTSVCTGLTASDLQGEWYVGVNGFNAVTYRVEVFLAPAPVDATPNQGTNSGNLLQAFMSYLILVLFIVFNNL